MRMWRIGKMQWCGFLAALTAACLFLLAGCGGDPVEGKGVKGPERTYNELAAFYQLVLDTPLSPSLKKRLGKIVRARLHCYDIEQGYDGRLRECRDAYISDTLQMARENIPAAPRLGAFVLCVRDCPISYAICAGEHSVDNGVDCVAVESQCIEYCLDLYWRGGISETRAGRTRALGMPDRVSGRDGR